MGAIQSILVRSPNWIGDQILAYPFFHYLRESNPKAKISVVCVPWVESIQFKNLIDEVIVIRPSAKSGWFSRFGALESAAKQLKKAGSWELGISLPHSFSSAWLIYRAGIKRRRGYETDSRKILLTEPVAWNQDTEILQHRSQAYVDLLPTKPSIDIKEFWGVPPLNDLDPGVPGVLPAFDAVKAWPEVRPIEPPAQPYWVLAPGSTAESRRWDEARFSALARRVYENTGCVGLIVGGPTEAPIALRLKESSGAKLQDWTALGPVSSLWKIFRQARFTVSNDSGLAHVASLCGSPVQIVWGAGNPKRTEPLGPGKVKIVFNPVDCWPCERNTCAQPREKKLECLRGIDPDAVWQEIQSGIQGQH